MQLFVKAAYFPPCLISSEASASIAAVCSAYSRYQGLTECGPRRVVYEGRTLNETFTLEEAGVSMYGTIELVPRLLGGGGDGGSTGAESRACYLEMYMGKKPDKVNPEEERLAKWTTCQLTGMPLQPPCVCDELGSLFNKDAVIQALVSKSMPKGLSHISSLKHVFDLKLERSTDAKQGPTASTVQFVCPITGQAFNGKYKFVVVRSTGHVLSERALKEVPQVVEELVGFKITPADLIPVNPPAEELFELRVKLLEQRAAARAAKRDGKKAKDKVAVAAGAKRPAEGALSMEGNNKSANGTTTNGLYAGEAARNGDANGNSSAAPAAAGKKFRATELMPSHADKKVWESLFISSRLGDEKETYLCRSNAARGMHLT